MRRTHLAVPRPAPGAPCAARRSCGCGSASWSSRWCCRSSARGWCSSRASIPTRTPRWPPPRARSPSTCPPSAATSSTATAGRSPTRSTARWSSPTRSSRAAKAPELAKFLASRLDIDYFETLKALRLKDKRFAYIARRVPASKAEAVVAAAEEAGLRGPRHPARPDPRLPRRRRGAPTWSASSAPTRRSPASRATSTSSWPAPTARSATPSAAATGSRSATRPSSRRSTARTSQTTIDLDLQWYTQRVLRQTVEDARADSGFAVVMDTKTGEVLALADHPTFDARTPAGGRRQGPRVPGDDRRLRAGLGGEGAHPQRAHRRRQGHRAHPRHGAAGAAQRRPRHPRLVRPRHLAPDARRRARPVVQHRHGAGRAQLRDRPAARLPARSSASARRPTSESPARPRASCPTRASGPR